MPPSRRPPGGRSARPGRGATFPAMRETGADRLVPEPPSGRVFRASRRARFGDISPGGRTRFDALARYLQDVSSDDSVEAGLDDSVAWVVRRTVFEVGQAPRFREMVELATFCSGLGGRWAERRVSMRGDQGAVVDAATIWVRIDAETGKPLPVGERFHEIYAEAAQARHVTARLLLPPRPPEVAVRQGAWPLRFADFDLLSHVNNAASWAMVEEQLAERRDLRPPYRAELEYRAPIERGDHVELLRHDDDDGFAFWAVPGPAPGGAGGDVGPDDGQGQGGEAFLVGRVTTLAR